LTTFRQIKKSDFEYMANVGSGSIDEQSISCARNVEGIRAQVTVCIDDPNTDG